MKKVCLMSGAVINAGDFLIEQRSLNLIKHFMPDADVTILNRVGIDYTNKLDYLNGFDAIIFGGGPIYQPGIYGNSLPFVTPQVLQQGGVKPPVFFMGGGMKGSFFYSSFSENDRLFFNLGTIYSVPLACRDVVSYRFLKHEGYPALMTGCPCWYDLDYLDKKLLNRKIGNSDNLKICISEPAQEKNVPLLIGLLHHLRNRFPLADLTLVIHREAKASILKSSALIELNVKTINISGTVDGLKVYDNCDLHTGFRVHAHIYNLSRRNLSILFNEDIRGYGINQTLGLENLNIEEPPYTRRKLFGKYNIIKFHYDEIKPQEKMGRMFDDFLNTTIEDDYHNYEHAFIKMINSFNQMGVFFTSIKNAISY